MHLIKIVGLRMFLSIGGTWYILGLIFGAIGGMIYALRLPERYFPGKCDIYVCFYSFSVFFYLALTLFN